MNARPISVWRAVPGDDDHLSSGVDAVNLKPALGKIETIVVIGIMDGSSRWGVHQRPRDIDGRPPHQECRLEHRLSRQAPPPFLHDNLGLCRFRGYIMFLHKI